jgi:hypothetical protein
MNNVHNKSMGRQTVFSQREENCFVSHHLLKAAEWGFPFDLMDIRIIVAKLFKSNWPCCSRI